MMKNLLILLIVFLYKEAQNSQKPLESKIEKVIVFLNGGQIIKTAKTTLNPGKTEKKIEIEKLETKEAIIDNGIGKYFGNLT